MPILNRLSSLVFADVHAVLDKLEDPYTSLNLAVHEMEAALVETKQEIATLKTNLEKQQRLRKQIAEQLTTFEEELGVCFESREEALAKAVLRKKLACENTLAHLDKKISELEQNRETQEALHRENERHLYSMREKLALFDNEIESNETNIDARRCSYEAVSDEAVEVAFLREQQRRKSL